MKAEDIIEGLNQSIEDKRDALKIKATGHLVLQRTVKPHQTFKAYKEYESIVWFVKGGKKYIYHGYWNGYRKNIYHGIVS